MVGSPAGVLSIQLCACFGIAVYVCMTLFTGLGFHSELFPNSD